MKKTSDMFKNQRFPSSGSYSKRKETAALSADFGMKTKSQHGFPNLI